jgi:hypothetical protein
MCIVDIQKWSTNEMIDISKKAILWTTHYRLSIDEWEAKKSILDKIFNLKRLLPECKSDIEVLFTADFSVTLVTKFLNTVFAHDRMFASGKRTSLPGLSLDFRVNFITDDLEATGTPQAMSSTRGTNPWDTDTVKIEQQNQYHTNLIDKIAYPQTVDRIKHHTRSINCLVMGSVR